MNKLSIALAVLAVVIAGCSGGTITEDYKGPSVKAASKSQGTASNHFHYKGKNYILVKGSDGKYYAVEYAVEQGAK